MSDSKSEDMEGIDSPNMTEPASRCANGLEKYINSQELSDVTIRYGRDGERVFNGHKIALCRRSCYFQALFQGNFSEPEQKGITLHEDDPDALYIMLAFCYFETREVGGPALVHPYDAAIFYLSTYEVADKYDVPLLRDICRRRFTVNFQTMVLDAHEVEHGSTTQEEYMEELQHVIEKVYNTAPRSILGAVLKASYEFCRADECMEDPRVVFPVMRTLCRKLPHFAQDMFLLLLDDSNCAVSAMVHTQCRQCSEWRVEPHEAYESYCAACKRLTKSCKVTAGLGVAGTY